MKESGKARRFSQFFSWPTMGRILHVNTILEWLTPELVARPSFHRWCNKPEVPFQHRKKQPPGYEYRCSNKRKHESFQDPSDFDFRIFSRLWILHRNVLFFLRASVNEEQILVTLRTDQIKFICRYGSRFNLAGIWLNCKYNLRDLLLCIFTKQSYIETSCTFREWFP